MRWWLGCALVLVAAQAHAGSFRWLGSPDGFSSTVSDLSGDGSTLISSPLTSPPWRWRSKTGWESLGLPGFTFVQAASRDGRTLVGYQGR